MQMFLKPDVENLCFDDENAFAIVNLEFKACIVSSKG